MESRNFCLKVKFQPINVERIITTEKSPFANTTVMISEGKNHQRMLKLLSENTIRNEILTEA